MKTNFSIALTCLALFLGCALVTFILLDLMGGGSPAARPGPSVVSHSSPGSVVSINSVDEIKSDSLHSQSRDLMNGGGVRTAESDVEAVRRLSAELEFEFMVVTRPKILSPEAFNGDLSAMSRFVMRLMSDHENTRKSKEIENLHAEFFQSEDLRRKREILDRLKVIREDMLGVVNKEVKAESALHRDPVPSSPSGAVPSESPVKTFQ